MKGQTVPRPAARAATSGTTSKPKSATSTIRTGNQTTGRNPKEVALESSLKRKETEQLESFIHNRSKQLDVEIEKMRSKMHDKSLSPSSRRHGDDQDDHESRSRRRYLDNLSDEEQEEKWNVRGRHLDRQARSRSPEQEKKMYDNEERLKRRSEQMENDLYQREVKQRPPSHRDDYGRRNNNDGVRDDSDLEQDYPNPSRHEGDRNVNRMRDDGQSSSMGRKGDVGYGDRADERDMNRDPRGDTRRDGAREPQQHGGNARDQDRNTSSRQSNTYNNNDDRNNNNYNSSNDRNRSNNNNNDVNNTRQDPPDNPLDRLLTRLSEAFYTAIHQDHQSSETIRDTLLGHAYVKGSSASHTQIPLKDVLHPLSIVVPPGGMSFAVNLVRHWTFSLYYIGNNLFCSFLVLSVIRLDVSHPYPYSFTLAHPLLLADTLPIPLTNS